MILGHFFQLIFVNHLDSYLFPREHVSGRFDNSKMPFAQGLFQIVHTSDIATIMFGRSDGVGLSDHAATVLHRSTRRDRTQFVSVNYSSQSGSMCYSFRCSHLEFSPRIIVANHIVGRIVVPGLPRLTTSGRTTAFRIGRKSSSSYSGQSTTKLPLENETPFSTSFNQNINTANHNTGCTRRRYRFFSGFFFFTTTNRYKHLCSVSRSLCDNPRSLSLFPPPLTAVDTCYHSSPKTSCSTASRFCRKISRQLRADAVADRIRSLNLALIVSTTTDQKYVFIKGLTVCALPSVSIRFLMTHGRTTIANCFPLIFREELFQNHDLLTIEFVNCYRIIDR